MATASTEPRPYLEVRETHSGLVLCLGERVYKMKKAVDLGFLDFSSREARERVCHREVELNCRLSPDVYLGVADVSGTDGAPCEHLVVMRRMPDERRLSTLVRAGAPVRDGLRKLARLLVAFHARAQRGPEISREGTRDALLARWDDSFQQVRPFAGEILKTEAVRDVERLVHRFLAGRETLFTSRMEGGHVVDGHGDLLADDIFLLDDGPRVLDCLEFDDRLRYVDAVDDASFLVMDLERLGVPELARAFFDWYVEYADEPAPAALSHHYVAYRAFVRAKVACLRHAQGAPEAADHAQLLTALTLRHLRAGAVALVLVGGLPGTGKTTVAGGLADQLNLTLLSSDRVRKALAGLDPQDRAAAAYGAGIYTPEWTGRTYAELLSRAEKLLARGETVVLDASWTDARSRADAAALAERMHAELVELQCVAPSELTAQRMRRRHGDASDADAAIAQAISAHADPWPDATPIDTRRPVEDSVATAVAASRPPGVTRQ